MAKRSRSSSATVLEYAVAPNDEESSISDRVIAKLEQVLQDHDLSLVLGPYMADLILAGLLEQRELSQAQYDRLVNLCSVTLDEMLDAKQIEDATIQAARYANHERISDFARV